FNAEAIMVGIVCPPAGIGIALTADSAARDAASLWIEPYTGNPGQGLMFNYEGFENFQNMKRSMANPEH
ncbi:MAG TPA: hypothetical protein VMS65_06380, partial [Polyangiaceae bacterium]|nr:hypothetical protein [Polyangiaceae bacterium]